MPMPPLWLTTCRPSSRSHCQRPCSRSRLNNRVLEGPRQDPIAEAVFRLLRVEIAHQSSMCTGPLAGAWPAFLVGVQLVAETAERAFRTSA
eukprot:CAMPEP_0176089644 /NCGR_PEP_ID=MMETSP0120_2-20121206/44895_1 /TAXON_ID=160619 /ORGANISM="Kryptoperidinium foliaceum, Strain CCMP 1326" /LENGTH=90 /DNA_ID=CAMNT_0017423523 /DNA_START=65 /DNA_END=337 /DNA_ORIENTATION=-